MRVERDEHSVAVAHAHAAPGPPRIASTAPISMARATPGAR
jgi:hypothetical protein